MNSHHRSRIVYHFILATCLAATAQAAPLGTAFTYQGRLTEGGSPANGSYDLRCALFDAASAGNQIGAAVTNRNVAVSLAAIQGLNEKVEVRSERAEGRIQKAEISLQELREELKSRDAENEDLRTRLSALEKLVAKLNQKGN
jgi:chromosome segregation ATPase